MDALLEEPEPDDDVETDEYTAYFRWTRGAVS
jgi:hypothetical protein